jgi:hypothetical protein
MAEQHYAALGRDTQATAAELIAALRTIGWFREVDHLEDLAAPADFRLRVRVRGELLNEPMLAVMTLGLVPHPMAQSHGYELAMLDERGEVVKQMDTLYTTTGTWGWVSPAIALLPNQFLATPADRHARYFAHLLIVEAPELLMPCG